MLSYLKFKSMEQQCSKETTYVSITMETGDMKLRIATITYKWSRWSIYSRAAWRSSVSSCSPQAIAAVHSIHTLWCDTILHRCYLSTDLLMILHLLVLHHGQGDPIIEQVRSQ